MGKLAHGNGESMLFSASNATPNSDETESRMRGSRSLLLQLDHTNEMIQLRPYNLFLYTTQAQLYLDLDYPDLAAGAAYKALLLSDAAQDEGDEYHQAVLQSLQDLGLEETAGGPPGDNQAIRNEGTSGVDSDSPRNYLPLIYHVLSQSLLLCGCYRSAFLYCSQACNKFPEDGGLRTIYEDIRRGVAHKLGTDVAAITSGKHSNTAAWPDAGFVRREQYPWNPFEPDRLNDLSTLNKMMELVAPKLEVLAVELPNLSGTANGASSTTVIQLGVFAKEDLHLGEFILKERSLLTANNKLQDALCDACSEELPELASAAARDTVSCPDCDVVFCSQKCYDEAVELYHPALCDMDVESIAKDVAPTEASDALYSLLLLRALAMAETQQCHPLELKEVRYIWGDFRPATEDNSGTAASDRTLPFSFEHNIRLPFHMLEKMDIDIFANQQYDVWVFNVLYAKFRGTASARLSGLGGQRARGPEVSAVHPMWCLANHSCDPNVSWSWGGSIEFEVRKSRPPWRQSDGIASRRSSPGIKKGDEILNHYCDVDLPVNERREWARGALGGNCRCSRCVWEANEAATTSV